MNRRTLLKFLPASLAGLVAAPVLGKVKPKAKFPRYFAPKGGPLLCLEYPRFDLVYARADASARVVAVWAQRSPNLTHLTLADCEKRVKAGDWKEITAAEAEALLYPTYKRAMRLQQGPAYYDRSVRAYAVATPTEWKPVHA